MSASAGKTGSLREPAVVMAGWLGYAAAPVFASMAGISAVGAPGTMMCSVAPGFVPVNDMALMYLLMSLFHASPWLRVLSGRSRDPGGSITQTEGE